MKRSLMTVVGLAIILGSGAVHGIWSNRWSAASEPAASAKKLEQLAPRIGTDLGNWSGQPVEIEAREIKAAGIMEFFARRYTNRNDGTRIAVFLVCGEHGPISVHIPERCYQGSGYQMATEAQPYRLEVASPALAADFWVADFLKPDAVTQNQLRIFWTFGGLSRWSAPEQPRLAFAGYPALYKLYVIRENGDFGIAAQEDPTIEFAKLLMPKLQETLFGKPGESLASTTD